jgi:hypothetical protein
LVRSFYAKPNSHPATVTEFLITDHEFKFKIAIAFEFQMQRTPIPLQDEFRPRLWIQSRESV